MPDGPDIVAASAAGASTPAERATGHGRNGTSAQPMTLRLLLGWVRRLSPDAWLAVALALLALALRLWPLGAASTEYDEGVYWQSLRAMSLGHPLFSSIFSSQPPLFLLSIYPFYLLFGSSLAAARAAVVLYSLAGLLAIYVAGRSVGGRWVGLAALALLALDPLYLLGSHTLEAEVPALACAGASVALAVLAVQQAGYRRRWLAGAAGLVLALGCGIKLFDIAALAPVALYLLAPASAALTDAAGRLRWPGGTALRRALRSARPDLLASAAGALIGAGVVMLPFAGQWPALYDEVVRFHLAAARSLSIGMYANLLLLSRETGELPLALLATAGALASLAVRRWRILPPALWACASFVVLVRQQPLFPHHVALLIPPLALTAAVGLPSLAEILPAALGAGRGMLTDARGRGALAVLLAGVVLVWSVGATTVQSATPPAAAPCPSATTARALAASTQPGDLVVADDQYIVALAGRDVPPQLVDTSLVRIQSGYLTTTQLETAIRAPDVRAILFCSGRFDLVPGFRDWVNEHYLLVASFGQQGALYLKLPPGNAPV